MYEYRLITANDEKAFTKLIEVCLKGGWKLQGNLVVAPKVNDPNLVMSYHQAMTKEIIGTIKVAD